MREDEHTLLDASVDLLQREHPCVGLDANPDGQAPGPDVFIARWRA
ncbi:hypothetical protein GCM10009102_30610 [Sphingomonas insulae]|uniref:Uncharacterized protein n=1 Tax=Sphingomonas insulae TaxID=424800 RepID=A0ABP3T613_9SPHN